jgi:integrase
MLWFRIAVPRDLRAHFGMPEICTSLRTSDVFVAKEKALQLAQKFRREFQRARRESCMRDLDDEAAWGLVQEMLMRLCDIYEQALDSIEMSPAEYFDRWRHSESHRDFLINLLCEFGFKPDDGSEGWARLCSAFHDGVNGIAKLIQQEYPRLQKLEAEAAKARARYNRRLPAGVAVALPVPSPEIAQASRPGQGKHSVGLASVSEGRGDLPEVVAQSQRAATSGGSLEPTHGRESRSNPTLDKLIDSWAAEKGEDLNPKTEECIRAAFKELASYARVRYASEVTVETVIGFKMFLLQRGKGVAVMGGKDHSRPGRQNSAVTVKKKIGYLSLVFAHAVDNRLICENPAAGVKVKTPKNPKKSRVQFEADDIRRIFSTPLYMEKLLPVTSRGGGEAAYWLPLLENFSGARPEELGQLHISDVKRYRTRDGKMIPFITVNNAGDKGTKNSVSNRNIPLHPELIRRGFMDYVESQPPEGRLFPLLQPDKYGNLTSGFSKWFNGTYLRRQIGITDRRKVNYSFRHSFVSACRNTGMSSTLEYALTGHELGTVHESYGEPPSVAALYSALMQVQFDGFPFEDADRLQG